MRIVLDCADGTGGQCSSVHDAGIKLNFTEQIWNATGSYTLITNIILNCFHRGDCGIDSRTTSTKDPDRRRKPNCSVATSDDDPANILRAHAV